MKKTIFILLILGLIVYSLYLIAEPYYNYYAFKSDAEERLRIILSPDPLRTKEEIMKIAVKYELPIEKDDIDLKWERRYHLRVSWEETVDFFTIYQKTFKFRVDTRNLIPK